MIDVGVIGILLAHLGYLQPYVRSYKNSLDPDQLVSDETS